MSDEQSAVERLEQIVALASGRIYVPPHVRISEKGKRQNVDGYWRKRKPGEKGNVASLPAGVSRQQPKGRNAGGRRQPNGGIDAKDMKKTSDFGVARERALADVQEMFDDGPPTKAETDAALKQRMDREPNMSERTDFMQDVARAYRTNTRPSSASDEGDFREPRDRGRGGSRSDAPPTAQQSALIDEVVDDFEAMGGQDGKAWATEPEIRKALEKRGLGNEWDVAAVKARIAARNRNKGGGSAGAGSADEPAPVNTKRLQSMRDVDFSMLADEMGPEVTTAELRDELREQMGRKPSPDEMVDARVRMRENGARVVSRRSGGSAGGSTPSRQDMGRGTSAAAVTIGGGVGDVASALRGTGESAAGSRITREMAEAVRSGDMAKARQLAGQLVEILSENGVSQESINDPEFVQTLNAIARGTSVGLSAGPAVGSLIAKMSRE